MRDLWRGEHYNGLVDFIKNDEDVGQYIVETVRKQFLGRAYLRLGNNEEAKRLLEEALSLSAQVPEEHRERFIRVSKGFLDQAKH